MPLPWLVEVGPTVTVNVAVAVSWGAFTSVATTVTVYTPGVWPLKPDGVQVKTPVRALMAAPAGAPAARLKVSGPPTGLDAVTVNDRPAPLATFGGLIGLIVGAW